VAWYAQRWQIEVLHKVLKSGCQIEQRQLETAARLERALSVDLVVAWRLLALCKAAREEPDAAVSAWLSQAEWEALCCYVVSGRKLPILGAARDVDGGRERVNGRFWPRPHPNRQNSPAVATLPLSDLACGFKWGGFKPPTALAWPAPIDAPATPARSRAGCSSSLRSRHTANSPAAPRPGTGSVRDVPGC